MLILLLRRSSLRPKMSLIYWRRETRRGRPDKQTGCVYHIRSKHDANFQNERSSRSHSVFTIVIESKPRDGNGDDDVRLSRLTLIVSSVSLTSTELMSRIWLVLRKQSRILRGGVKANISIEGMSALSFSSHQLTISLLALKTVINKLTDKKRSAALTH
jgi:hypothetical protein